MPDHKQPWWNDGDRVAGMAATVVVIIVLTFLVAGSVKVLLWMF